MSRRTKKSVNPFKNLSKKVKKDLETSVVASTKILAERFIEDYFVDAPNDKGEFGLRIWSGATAESFMVSTGTKQGRNIPHPDPWEENYGFYHEDGDQAGLSKGYRQELQNYNTPYKKVYLTNYNDEQVESGLGSYFEAVSLSIMTKEYFQLTQSTPFINMKKKLEVLK